MACHGEGGTHAACLKRAGGIQALILNKQVAVLAAGEHGSHAFAERYRFDIRQHGRIAPHTRGTVADRFTRHMLTNVRQIVANVQRASVFGTHIASDIGSQPLAALTTFETEYFGQWSIASETSQCSTVYRPSRTCGDTPRWYRLLLR